MLASRLGCLVLCAALASSLGACGKKDDDKKPPPPPSPDVPQNVSATPDCSEILITWDPVAGAISYTLYWSTSPGVTRASPSFMGITSNGFLHQGAVPGTTYYYRATTITAPGESDLSAEVSAATTERPVPSLPPDSFTQTDTLTSRNPTLQNPYLAQPKDSMTATTLPLECGMVVLTGGTSGGTALNATEIYDQRTAEFTPSGNMGQARRHHSATLTAAGDIVVIGGIGQSQAPLISAEIWRASTGTYDTLSQMRHARAGHTATSLPSGEILVIGGVTDSLGEHVTESVEALNLSTSLWREHTPIQATNSQEGIPRALHTANLLAGPNGIRGDGDDILVVIGGVLGNKSTKEITSLTSSVSVYYPNETTSPPNTPPNLPGAWKNLLVQGSTSEPARLGHHAFVINSTTDLTQIMLVGGLASQIPARFFRYTDTAAGLSFLEDSPGTTYDTPTVSDVAILDIDNTTLGGGVSAPEGGIFQQGVDFPAWLLPFVGGFGARAVYSPERHMAIYSGGNTYDCCPPVRIAYNRTALRIELREDPPEYLTVWDPMGAPMVYVSAGQMGDIRSFHAATMLPGADGLMDTIDDTVFMAGGEQSPSGETKTADEYTFPLDPVWP